jgi:hypothetical protein
MQWLLHSLWDVPLSGTHTRALNGVTYAAVSDRLSARLRSHSMDAARHKCGTICRVLHVPEAQQHSQSSISQASHTHASRAASGSVAGMNEGR